MLYPGMLQVGYKSNNFLLAPLAILFYTPLCKWWRRPWSEAPLSAVGLNGLKLPLSVRIVNSVDRYDGYVQKVTLTLNLNELEPDIRCFGTLYTETPAYEISA